MAVVASKDSFSISLITPELVEECADVCTVAFLTNEVMCRCTRPPRENFKKAVTFLIETSLETQVSTFVRDESKGKIVSCCIVMDYEPTKPITEDVMTHESLVHNLEFVESLQGFFTKAYQEKIGTEIVHGDIAHIFVNATLPEYEGKGLMKWQLENLFAPVAKKGYKCCVAELTGFGTQHIYPKFGFEELGRVYYKNYKNHEGVNPYQDAKPGEFCNNVVKWM
eukprot:TRINITY_DN4922_c0_g2_i1.p1 TRINITY_DN4922_c0_g2~~TRINITY_DN4922_c0_g2_i1.p1  ORF type:complete len:224 (+),score=39.55 TRINITY_DN4922_c0_g2_i1:198-869(+)